MDHNDIRANKRRAVLNRFKRMKGCIDCGYKRDHRALEFDHLSGKRGKTVAGCCYSSWAVIKREIAKCVVRCANCHAIATHERNQNGRWRGRLGELANPSDLGSESSGFESPVAYQV